MALPAKVKRLRSRDFPYTRVIIISPHPDDSVLGCGGLLYKLTGSMGVDVGISIFVMTPGYRGVDDDFYEQHMGAGRANLDRWLHISTTQLQNIDELIGAVRHRLGEENFDLFGDPCDDTDEQKLENVLKTAIRFGESCRDAERLGLDPESCLHFLALPKLYARCITPGELTVLRNELRTVADHDRDNLVLVPHPNDPQSAHQVATEAAIRALDPEIQWHIWYYQSPWYALSLEEIDVVVSLNDEERSLKIAAAETHRSQTARTPYGAIVSAEASLNADVLPELVFGFGAERPHALGKYCEVFQMRLRTFYTCKPEETELWIYSDDHLPIDDDPETQ